MTWKNENTTTAPPDFGKVDSPASEEDEGIMGGSTVEETSLAHEVMAVIAPWTEPFIGYLLYNKMPDDQTEARRIIHQSKAYRGP